MQLEKYIKRIKDGSLPRFVLTDFIEEHLEPMMNQASILDMAQSACRHFGLDLKEAEYFRTYYPRKKLITESGVYHMNCNDGLPLCKASKPKGILTDFPYGIAFQSNSRTKTEKLSMILNDEEPFLDDWIKHSHNILGETGFFLTFYRWDVQTPLFEEIIRAGFKIKSQIVWDKGTYGMGDLEGSFAQGHELAVFATKGNWKFPSHAGRPHNIRKSQGVGARVIHPNEKPVPLIRSLVRDLTCKGDLIIEPFSGSGSCIEACIAEERECIAFELDDRKMVQIDGLTYIEYGNKRRDLAKIKSNSLF